MPKIVDHERRRAELSEALWRVALRDGFDAVTVRSVAQEAGWSAGALRHYFPDKAEMVLFAVDLIVGTVQDRVRELYDSGDRIPAPEALQMHLEQLLPLDPARRVESEVWFALVTLARSDARVARRRHEIDDVIRGSVESVVLVLAEIGRLTEGRDQALETRRLHALLDGLVIQLTADPPRLTADEARAIVAGHLADLAGEPGVRLTS
ncbi:TetR family transcriptional regulator C-terminal domain-containing protein [Catenulispora sp. NF23]|uniref:TetR/AcrR family transcriptional regulator n=1 Tax=Catenulispora pinistramenti TaxID=2705254 RepID=UPI001BA71E83|nr:TetR family transcriptional regulator C-terminal domain-containing protein [Catenulispora pinistramenti]MBS2535354.1 TetR family transcriptional regulator C-terminal domain-containing protein [Catenulispora pinistramenti]